VGNRRLVALAAVRVADLPAVALVPPVPRRVRRVVGADRQRPGGQGRAIGRLGAPRRRRGDGKRGEGNRQSEEPLHWLASLPRRKSAGLSAFFSAFVERLLAV